MANESIIKAAGQAYAPNPGQYDLSGFIQGISAVAGGLVKKQQEAAKRGKQADELYLSSDNTVVQGIVTGLQDQVRSGAITQGKAKQKLADLDRNYNKDLPQIELMVKDIFKKGISKSAGELEENYLLGLSLGELDNPITINGEQFSTFYSVDPATNSLTVLSPNGEYVSPRELKATLNNTATIEDRNDGNAATRVFTKPTYKDGETSNFTSASNTFKNDMKSVFQNTKKRDSWLLDNPQGFEITTFNKETRTLKFEEFYLQNGLSEEQNEIFDTELAKFPAETKEKAKLMIIKDLMKSDNNLDADIDMFLNKFINAKEPKPIGTEIITSTPTVSGFTMNGKLLQSEKQDIQVINSVEQAVEQVKTVDTVDFMKAEDIQLLGGAVLLKPVKDRVYTEKDKLVIEGERKVGDKRYDLWYFTKNMKGETDKEGDAIDGTNYSAVFNPKTISKIGMNKIMNSVLTGVPGGLTFGSTVYTQYQQYENK
tara:strand:- start:37 stop:1488 length:1452 start_codon:yes stop_codon:yes gene_type:complete